MNRIFFYFLIFFNFFFITRADESLSNYEFSSENFESEEEIIEKVEKIIDENNLENFFKEKKNLWLKLSDESKSSCPFCK